MEVHLAVVVVAAVAVAVVLAKMATKNPPSINSGGFELLGN